MSEVTSDQLREGDTVVLYGSTSSSNQSGNPPGEFQSKEVIQGESAPAEQP
jgi:hypothetical protein